MALPAGSVRSPAKPRMRDLCQCGIGAPNTNILQMSEVRNQESAATYSGLEQRSDISPELKREIPAGTERRGGIREEGETG
ncbi:hypothetical protein NQZ68_004690 [Dissostichus eleginoides]|nr:hypothetical protein NQZ68_004690 [Dissostichus eleginoides]